MTRASAKFIALAIVQKWYWKGCPVSGSLNGYRVAGTLTGRMTRVLDMSNYPEVVAIRRELAGMFPGPTFDEVPPDPPTPYPDILTDRETAAAIQRRLFDYAAADAELTARFAVQPVLREGNE